MVDMVFFLETSCNRFMVHVYYVSFSLKIETWCGFFYIYYNSIVSSVMALSFATLLRGFLTLAT